MKNDQVSFKKKNLENLTVYTEGDRGIRGKLASIS